MELGRRLRALRTARDLTQSELARRAGLELVTLSRIELGKTTARDATVVALAGALDVPRSALESPQPFIRALADAYGVAAPPVGVGTETPLMGRVAAILERVPPERQEHLVTVLEGLAGALGEPRPVAPSHREPVGRREDDGRDLGDPVAH